MDIMEVREGTGYETMNTERKWTIDLFSPGPDRGGFLSKKSGDPTLWRYVIYDDEDLIVETDFSQPTPRRHVSLCLWRGREVGRGGALFRYNRRYGPTF